MEKVTLNNKEQKRLLVLNEVLAGRMTGQDAAEMLGLSLRHTRRLIAGYRQSGAAALAHGNRGRPPANKLDDKMAEEIVRLARGEYLDYNDTHFTEELAERHDIMVSSRQLFYGVMVQALDAACPGNHLAITFIGLLQRLQVAQQMHPTPLKTL